VLNNYIGTDAWGLSPLGNTEDGVKIWDGAIKTTIGGLGLNQMNVISGNGNDGVFITNVGVGTQVLGNYIGVGSDGVTPLGNSGDGVWVDNTPTWNLGDPPTVTIGGAAAGAANIIADNGGFGVNLGLHSQKVLVQGNTIGLDADGNTLANTSGWKNDLGTDNSWANNTHN
jgi:hypothetical protein